MSSREKILSGIKANKPTYTELPEKIGFVWDNLDLEKLFMTVLQGIGGAVVQVPDLAAVERQLPEVFPTPGRIINTVPGITFGQSMTEPILDGHSLETVDVGVILGAFAVAENGCIWVPEETLPHRVFPFICQHLVAIVPRSELVATMHQAYERLNISQTGYGAFIAGPSKTADIEQSLVIGAHGPRSLTAFLVG